MATIASLILALTSAAPDERRRAAETLGSRGRHAAGAVEPLAGALSDPDPAVREAAAGALGRIGLAAGAAAPALVDALRHPIARDEAVAALQKLDLRPVLGRLAEAAIHDDEAVRSATATLLRPHAARAVPLLLAATHAGREPIAAASIAAIGTIAFSAVVACLVEPSVAARAELVLLSGDPDMATAAVVDALSATDTTLREEVRALLRGHDRWVCPALRATRRSEHGPRAREDVFAAIGLDAALPILIHELENADPTVRAQAAYALATFGSHAAAAVPALADAIRRGEAPAVSALRNMGPEAARGAPALVCALRDPALALRAFDTVMALGPGVIAAVVSDCLVGVNSPQIPVREATQRLLQALGPDHAAAVPGLTHALSHEAPEVRDAAARALVRIGPRATASVPALLALLSDPVAGSIAGVALVEIGTPHATAAIPALTRGLEHGGREDRLASIRALARLGSGAATAVPMLARLLGDEDVSIRAATVRLLAALGYRARAALPDLEVAAFDPDPQVKKAASDAAARLSQGPPIGRAGAGWQLADATVPGAEIASIVSGGPAARAGLQARDRVVGIDDEPVASPRVLLGRLAAASPGARWRLSVIRAGATHAIELELGTR